MGDGHLNLDKVEPAVEESKSSDVTPRSDIIEDIAPESISIVPSLPLVLEELHRNTNDTVNTPDISTASIQGANTPRKAGRRNFRVSMQPSDSEYGLPLGPAAGLGPQEPVSIDGNQEIYSVRGTRSLKISRHRDNVTVFPSGCMGIIDDEEHHEITPESVPAVVTTPATTTLPEVPADVAGDSPTATPSNTTTASHPLVRPGSASRNPLTGEGYFRQVKKQSPNKKKDGNPVLGQGYEETAIRTKKVPPGGFSQGLW